MPDILIRGLQPKVVSKLKERAKKHGRSLQGEAKLLLEQAAGAGGEEIAAIFEGWKKKLAGRTLSNSADLIREDRRR